MAATAQPVMMTVEQYRQLPDDNPAVSLELHLGQVVEVTRPKMKHARIQSQFSACCCICNVAVVVVTSLATLFLLEQGLCHVPDMHQGGWEGMVYG